MQPNDFMQYAPLITFSIATIMALITGTKWIYKRYSIGLDNRISGCIDTNFKPLHVLTEDHESRIKSLEDRFDDFKDIFISDRRRTRVEQKRDNLD